MITVSNIQNRLDFTTHAERFQQGGRNVYAFTATLSEINNLLPDRDPESETMVSDANRGLTLSHARDIQHYLAEEFEWLVSSILTHVDPDHIEFAGYPNDDGTTNPNIGVLNILKTPTGEKALGIFDGQHRRRAIRDLMRSIDLNDEDPHIQQLAHSKVPILLYEESSTPKLRQMFLDHGKSKATEANTNTRFNQHNPFSLAAVAITEDPDFKSVLFRDRVEMERTRLAHTSNCIITINQLERAIKNAELGYSGRLSRERELQYHKDGVETLYRRSLKWADEFLPEARDEYHDLYRGTLENSEIPAGRDRSLAYNATILHVLAACYHEWRKHHEDWRPLAKFIREADFRPGKGLNEGALLVDAGLVLPNGITPLPRAQEVTHAIRYIVRRAIEYAQSPNSIYPSPLVPSSTDSAGAPESNVSSHPDDATTPAVEVAFLILSERDGETMHYKDLAEQVLTRNGDIRGDNPARNLVARLVNDDRFVRPARKGFYGLRRDYPTARNVGQRKTRARATTRAAQ